jgi:hypothetical protein
LELKAEARSEISRLAVLCMMLFIISDDFYLIPSEWGVIRYDNANKTFWHYLCGVIDSVEVNEYVGITMVTKETI